jgi:hypothetical protein
MVGGAALTFAPKAEMVRFSGGTRVAPPGEKFCDESGRGHGF